jgi:hypothetical protein
MYILTNNDNAKNIWKQIAMCTLISNIINLKCLKFLSHKKYLSVENKDFSGDEFHHCLKNIYFKKNILSQITCFFFSFVERMQKIVAIAYNM